MMQQEMNWEKLLSVERYGSSHHNTSSSEENRSNYDRDYGRILFSSAFRRLQDKTQVFPLGRNDYVRTRLTHSLEVAHVGSSLGLLVGDWLVKEGRLPECVTAAHLASIVSSACLAHDIGNPPFGHSGEDAIEKALKKHDIDFPFEGNAQGFRILTSIGDPMNGKGLKLTAAVLGAFMKYPCSRDYSKRVNAPDRRIECKKFGIGEHEVAAASFVAEKLGLLPRETNDAKGVCWCRHPLAYLMEAADDICYRIIDIEDGFFSGILRFDCVYDLYRVFLEEKALGYAAKLVEKEEYSSCVHYMRAMAIGASIRAVVDSFKENEVPLLSGQLNQSLIDCSILAYPLKQLYQAAIKHVYKTRDVVQVEAMGYRVLGELVDIFMEWVKNPSSGHAKKFEILLHGEDLNEESEQTRLIHMIDYVSGMTDSFALETYRKLSGIL